MQFWYTNSQKTPYYGRGDTPAPLPPPTPIEPGGTYAHSSSLKPPISGIGYHWQLQKTPPFPGFLGREVFQDYGQKITPLPEKMGIHMRPPHAFEWGGGGEGGRSLRSPALDLLLPLLLYQTPEEGYSGFPRSLKPWEILRLEWTTSHIQAGIRHGLSRILATQLCGWLYSTDISLWSV